VITKHEAMTLDTLYHAVERYSARAGGRAKQVRVTGRCKTWVTRPDDFRLPVKYGMYECLYITPRNAYEWYPYDPTVDGARRDYEAGQVGMRADAPWYMVRDARTEAGLDVEIWTDPVLAATG
jgi:hypothetical protein